MNDLKPFRFWCQKIMPLVYEDSLSYYELLCKVVWYINKILEDLKENLEDNAKLRTEFELLKKYVDNYFKNLDVQEEINNKLDEMALNGTLGEIINEEIFGEITENLNTLNREILKIPFTTPEMFGAKHDGINDDTNAIQDAINYALENGVNFKCFGYNYLISRPINLLTNVDAQRFLDADFGYSTLKATEQMEAVFILNTGATGGGFGNDVNMTSRVIKNVNIECAEKAVHGIHHIMARQTYYQNIQINNPQSIGFYGEAGGVKIDKMYFDNRLYDYNTGRTALKLNSADNKISNVQIRDYPIGVVINGASSYLYNVHCFLINQVTLNNSVSFVINSVNTHLTSCYSDTFELAFEINTTGHIFLDGVSVYINTEFYNPTTTTTTPTLFKFIDLVAANERLHIENMFVDSYNYFVVSGNRVHFSNYESADLNGVLYSDLNIANNFRSGGYVDKMPLLYNRLANIVAHPALTTGRSKTVGISNNQSFTVLVEGSNFKYGTIMVLAGANFFCFEVNGDTITKRFSNVDNTNVTVTVDNLTYTVNCGAQQGFAILGGSIASENSIINYV